MPKAASRARDSARAAPLPAAHVEHASRRPDGCERSTAEPPPRRASPIGRAQPHEHAGVGRKLVLVEALEVGAAVVAVELFHGNVPKLAGPALPDAKRPSPVTSRSGALTRVARSGAPQSGQCAGAALLALGECSLELGERIHRRRIDAGEDRQVARDEIAEEHSEQTRSTAVSPRVVTT